MFENARQARNFTTNVPKISGLKSSSEQIFSENCRWVPLYVCVRRVNLTTKFRFQNIKLRSFEFQKQYRRIPTHKECTNAKNFAYKRCMLGGEICLFDVIKHEGYFFQLDSRTARELKVDAYIELHNVLVEPYLHKRCNLAKPTEIFEAVQNTHNTCFFFNSRASHFRRHEYCH